MAAAWFRIAGVLALALLAAAPAHADFKRSYAKGLDAAAGEKWDEVEARMKEALAEESRPQANVKLYGMRFETYVPQYYLGLVAARRGDCNAALGLWSQPGVETIMLADNKMSGPAQKGIQDCKTRLAQGTKPPTTPVASNTPDKPVESAPPTNPTSSNTQGSTTQGSNTQANNTQGSTTRPPPVPPPAPPPAPPPVAPVEAPPAPAELARAVDNFLSGRYPDVVSLDPARLPDNRARYHALLLRAASRYQQALLQDEASSKSTLAQAEGDARAARQLFPQQVPDRALYSPRFRQFYGAIR